MDKKIISNISAAGMLRILCNYKKTGIFNIENKNKKFKIFIYNGEIINIKPSNKNIKEELINVLSSLDGMTFYFEEQKVEKGNAVELCIEDIILESARRIAKLGGTDTIKEFLLPENEILKISKFPSDRSIYIKFTSDEWNLLSSFDGNKSIDTVYNELAMEKNKAEIILYGLISAGLLRRARFKMPELTKIAREELGNIGVAIVDTELMKNKIDKTKMGMKEFLRLLASLENSFADIVGKTKARAVIEKIWEATK
ncbi:MAG: DUF4388 domain-containing protein [Candidatus Goldbacteria bacterium]|nr:DUF4388 domain-containing protein [Candidatus Goldiibacteriota bacterium]